MIYFQKVGNDYLVQKAGITIGTVSNGKFVTKLGTKSDPIKLTSQDLREIADVVNPLTELKKLEKTEVLGFRKFRTIGGGKEQFLGVCAGISYSVGIPVWIIRLIFVLILLFSNISIFFVYIIIWFVSSEWKKVPEDFDEITGS